MPHGLHIRHHVEKFLCCPVVRGILRLATCYLGNDTFAAKHNGNMISWSLPSNGQTLWLHYSSFQPSRHNTVFCHETEKELWINREDRSPSAGYGSLSSTPWRTEERRILPRTRQLLPSEMELPYVDSKKKGDFSLATTCSQGLWKGPSIPNSQFFLLW
jgi:hypothetical protein